MFLIHFAVENWESYLNEVKLWKLIYFISIQCNHICYKYIPNVNFSFKFIIEKRADEISDINGNIVSDPELEITDSPHSERNKKQQKNLKDKLILDPFQR